MKGKLVIGGGNIDASWKEIYGAFVSSLSDKKIAVVTKASSYPEESFESVKAKFVRLGVCEEDVLRLPLNCEEAERLYMKSWYTKKNIINRIDNSGGIWFCGGNQILITSELFCDDYSDTEILKHIRNVMNTGGVIGGSSAGAAIMSRIMITSGDDSGALKFDLCEHTDDSNIKVEGLAEQLTYSKGLGFMPNCLIDQHFNKRARLQRLVLVMKATGEDTGYGISEDTAMFVDLESSRIEVLGSAYVMKVVAHGDEVNLKYLYKNK